MQNKQKEILLCYVEDTTTEKAVIAIVCDKNWYRSAMIIGLKMGWASAHSLLMGNKPAQGEE
jgi:hypothetical protein